MRVLAKQSEGHAGTRGSSAGSTGLPVSEPWANFTSATDMTTTQQIVRCLKRDMGGDLLAGASYAERVARNAACNPWSPAEDAGNYAEAAMILRQEHERREQLAVIERLYHD